MVLNGSAVLPVENSISVKMRAFRIAYFPARTVFRCTRRPNLKNAHNSGWSTFSGGTFVSVKSWRKACLLSVLLSLMRSDSCFILAGVHPRLPFFVLCVFGVQPIVIAVLRSDRKLRDVQNNLNPSACDVPAQYCFTLSSVLILRGKPNVDTRCLWFHYMKLPFWYIFFLKTLCWTYFSMVNKLCI